MAEHALTEAEVAEFLGYVAGEKIAAHGAVPDKVWSGLDRLIADWRRLRDELADEQKADVEIQETCAKYMQDAERLGVQLTGCGVAALGGTQDPAKPGDYGWSASYQDVLALRRVAVELVRALKTMLEWFGGMALDPQAVTPHPAMTKERRAEQGAIDTEIERSLADESQAQVSKRAVRDCFAEIDRMEVLHEDVINELAQIALKRGWGDKENLQRFFTREIDRRGELLKRTLGALPQGRLRDEIQAWSDEVTRG